MDDLQFPIVTSYWWTLVVFIIGLALFHLLLVWPNNLSKVHWKIVDYIWLSLALVGILGAVSISRQEVAEVLLAMAKTRLETSAENVESAVRLGTSGGVCRKFVRSEYSPAPEILARMQKESDEQCKWFTNALTLLESTPLAQRDSVTLEALGGAPPDGGDDWAVMYLRESLDRYNSAVVKVRSFAEATQRSGAEWTFSLLAPFLLATALALRMAKVTGELLHERR